MLRNFRIPKNIICFAIILLLIVLISSWVYINRTSLEGYTGAGSQSGTAISATVVPRMGSFDKSGTILTADSGLIWFDYMLSGTKLNGLLDSGWSNAPDTIYTSLLPGAPSVDEVESVLFPNYKSCPSSEPTREELMTDVYKCVESNMVYGEGSAQRETSTLFKSASQKYAPIIMTTTSQQIRLPSPPLISNYEYVVQQDGGASSALKPFGLVSIFGTNFIQNVLIHVPYSDSVGNKVFMWNTATRSVGQIHDLIKAQDGFVELEGVEIASNNAILLPLNIGGVSGLITLDTGYMGPGISLYPNFYNKTPAPRIVKQDVYSAIDGVDSVFCEQFGVSSITLGTSINVPVLMKVNEVKGQASHGLIGSSVLSYLFDGVIFGFKQSAEGKPVPFFAYKLRNLPLPVSAEHIIETFSSSSRPVKSLTCGNSGPLTPTQYCTRCGATKQ